MSQIEATTRRSYVELSGVPSSNDMGVPQALGRPTIGLLNIVGSGEARGFGGVFGHSQ